MRLFLAVGLSIGLVAGAGQGMGQAPAAPGAVPAVRPGARPTPPTRDPNTPGYVTAKELADGAVPPANADGNFILGPTHATAAEMTAQDGVPKGTVSIFTMESKDSKIYPGIARDAGTFGTSDPNDPATALLGRFNRIYGVAGKAEPPSDYHGKYGFILD